MRFLLVIFLFCYSLHTSQAQELLKNDARAYRENGYQLQTAGDLQGALVYYEKAAQMDPYFAQVQNDLGIVYEAMGNDNQALAAYKKALEIDPNYLPTYTNLAFFYEKSGNIKNATIYWKRRYIAGEKGDYWWEVSRQHLVKLGTYPQVRKEIMEENAARLSREVIYKNEQERLMLAEEAKLHFDVGNRALQEGEYDIAVREFATVLSLDPVDEDVKSQTKDLYQESQRLYLRREALVNTENALDYIKNSDYLSAGDKLKNAISFLLRIIQDNK